MSQTFSAHETIFLLILKIKMVLCPHDALLQEVQSLSGCPPSPKDCRGSSSDDYVSQSSPGCWLLQARVSFQSADAQDPSSAQGSLAGISPNLFLLLPEPLFPKCENTAIP